MKRCEETFGEGLTIAWNQSRRFPVVADFHRGFDAPGDIGAEDDQIKGYAL